MFNLIFTRTSEILSAFFLPSPTKMSRNSLDFLLQSDANYGTELFLHLCKSGDAKELSTLKVKNVNIKKTVSAPEHEFILTTVRDSKDDKERLLILERTVNIDAEKSQDGNSIIEDFLGHESCTKVLTAVSNALLAVPPPLLVGCVAGVAGPGLSGIAAAAALLSPSLQVNPSYLPEADPIPEMSTNSFFDQATLNFAGFFNSLSDFAVSRRMSNSLNKPPKNTPADDRWLGEDKVQTFEYGTVRGAKSFEAYNLTLFHMALLAHVVHQEYPIYSLFKNNCYWFSSIIYHAARVIDHALGTRPGVLEDPDESRDVNDLFFLPFSQYLPHIAGCWMGFKICDVQGIVVNRIVVLFLKQLKEYEEEVILHSFLVTS